MSENRMTLENKNIKRTAILTIAVALLIFSSASLSVSGTETASGVEIDDALYEEEDNGKVEVVMRFGNAPSTQSDISELKSTAEQNEIAVKKLAKSTDNIQIKNNLWIANAVVVVVDKEKVPMEKLASVNRVERLHANFEIRAQTGGTRSQRSYDGSGLTSNVAQPSNFSDTQSSYTYGLQQINAPQTWNQFGTRGSGAKVAVLDTGVDPNHPDIDLYTEDPTDSTYPGGWAEFNQYGNRVGSEPYDSGDHGTHVSGTVAGGDASGTAIGVAPQAELMHGLTLPGGRGTFSQIVGGMQWAVENNADVISMSLGSPDYDSAWIDPIQNAQSQGTLVVSSSGNDGEGTSNSPGNIYDSISVGASNSNEDIASFSSGETVNTDQAYPNAPTTWPDEYVVPDVAAPGSFIESTLPGGEYGTNSGTSMAAPHVSGAAALMESASGEDLTPTEIRTALESTASKPDDWSEPGNERDARYGYGIIDVLDATGLVAADSLNASFTYTPSTPGTSESVSFDASSSFDPDGDIQSYDWSFGDGSTGSGVQVTHEYGSTGEYTVTLTVTGGDGETDTVSQTVSVSSGSGEGSATVSSRSVILDGVGDTGESAVTVDASNGVGIANVEVSVDTSVAEITNVVPGADVDTSDPAVTFDIFNETSDSVRVEYANIGAGTGQTDGFEFAQIEFVAQADTGTSPVGISSGGVYNGDSQQYSDVTVSEGQLTIGALFSQPLPSFDNPPTNTGEIDPTLYEDIDGDGDGTDPSEAVLLWGQLIQNPEDFDDLTQEQVDALDWSDDGQLEANDAVLLWGQQVQASG